MLKYSILFISALLLSLILTPLFRFAAMKLGAMDMPGERKIHSKPTPRLGGVPVFVAFCLVLAAASQFGFFYFPQDFLRSISFHWILLASLIILGLGIVDDFREVAPGIKFFFQIIAGLIVSVGCCRIEELSLPFAAFHLGMWSIPLTVFWIVAITNALNLLDGLDGLAAGVSFIVTVTLFLISLLQQNIGIALISMILAGALLGFLRYNFHPASIFLGDSGSYFIGFLLSILSLQGGLKGTTTVAILVPILTLGLPIMDTLLSMLRRLLKSLHIADVDPHEKVARFFFFDGKSMFRADRNHIHHRLLQMGFTQKKAVILLYSVSLALGGLALSSIYFRNVNHALLVTAIGIALYIGIRKLGYEEIRILRNGVLLPLFNAPAVNLRMLRVFMDVATISLSYYFAFWLRFEGDFASVRGYYLFTLPIVLITKTTVFYLTGLYRGAWRYTNLADLMKMFRGVAFGCAAVAFILWIIPPFGIISRAALLIDFNLLLLLVVGARGSFRILEHLHIAGNGNHAGKKVLIYGVEQGGIRALKESVDNPRYGLRPVGFIDDNPKNQGKQVNGYPVLGTLDSLEQILKKNSISEIILGMNELQEEKLDHLSQICSSFHVPIRRFQTRLINI